MRSCGTSCLFEQFSEGMRLRWKMDEKVARRAESFALAGGKDLEIDGEENGDLRLKS